MRRKALAVLSALVLASCFGRVSAWAAAPGDAHACCRGEAAPSKGPVLSDCCAVPAAVGAVSVVRVELPPILVSAPILTASFFVHEAIMDSVAPPGPDSLRCAVPARAPPLA